jgi:hypothetical protein
MKPGTLVEFVRSSPYSDLPPGARGRVVSASSDRSVLVRMNHDGKNWLCSNHSLKEIPDEQQPDQHPEDHDA